MTLLWWVRIPSKYGVSIVQRQKCLVANAQLQSTGSFGLTIHALATKQGHVKCRCHVPFQGWVSIQGAIPKKGEYLKKGEKKVPQFKNVMNKILSIKLKTFKIQFGLDLKLTFQKVMSP